MDFEWKGHTVSVASSGQVTWQPAGSARGGCSVEQDCATAPRPKGKEDTHKLVPGWEEAHVMLCKQSMKGWGGLCHPGWVSVRSAAAGTLGLGFHFSMAHVRNPVGVGLPESQWQQAGVWISLIPGQSQRKSSAAPQAPDFQVRCPGAALSISGDFLGLPGAGIRAGSAAVAKPSSLGSSSPRAHCLSCLLNTAFYPRSKSHTAKQHPAPGLFFSPFLKMIILKRIHLKKGKNNAYGFTDKQNSL